MLSHHLSSSICIFDEDCVYIHFSYEKSEAKKNEITLGIAKWERELVLMQSTDVLIVPRILEDWGIMLKTKFTEVQKAN